MSNTYLKEGKEHSRFRKDRQVKFERIGREETKKFCESIGYNVLPNDIGSDELVEYDKSDFIIHRENFTYLVEAETKGDDIWWGVFRGLHIPWRKLKYVKFMEPSEFAHFMVKKDRSELIITPGICFIWAEEEKNGCKCIYKTCEYIEDNHFMEISFGHLIHYKVTDQGYQLIRSGDIKIPWLDRPGI